MNMDYLHKLQKLTTPPLSKRELSKQLGITDRAIYAVLNGQYNLKQDRVDKINQLYKKYFGKEA